MSASQLQDAFPAQWLLCTQDTDSARTSDRRMTGWHPDLVLEEGPIGNPMYLSFANEVTRAVVAAALGPKTQAHPRQRIPVGDLVRSSFDLRMKVAPSGVVL